MNFIFYALAAPIFFSITTFIDKYLIDKKVTNPILITLLGGVTTFLIGTVILIFLNFPRLDFKTTLLLLTSGVFLVLYLVPYYKALQTDDTSRVTPLFQFVPLFSIVLALIFLKEKITFLQLFGFILVIGGGFFLGVEKVEGKIFKPRPALWLMILSSLFYAITLVIFRFIAIQHSFWTVLGYEYLGNGIGACLIFLLHKKKKKMVKELFAYRSILGLLTLNSSIAILGQISESYALKLATVALVSILTSTQPIFTLLIGFFLTAFFSHLLKEDIRAKTLAGKFIAIAIMFIGIFIVYK